MIFYTQMLTLVCYLSS